MPRLLLIVVLAPLWALAEVVCSLGSGASAYKGSGDQRPTPDTMQLAARVNLAMKPICADHCPQLGLYRNSTAANVMLVLDAGDAKLVYAPDFFARAYQSGGDAALVALLAHELGHALDDTMGAAWVNQKWAPELKADSWGACVLGRLALKENELAAAITALKANPSPNHPAWSQRLAPMRAGYSHCGGAAAAFDKAANPTNTKPAKKG